MTTEVGRENGAKLTISVEAVCYLVIGLVALGLRAYALGTAPLDATEAQQALAAWRLQSNSQAGPVATAIIALSLSWLGPFNAAARLGPMLAGMALVYGPLAFRRVMGRLPTMLTSAILAISPVAVAASRRVDGTTLAALFMIGALALITQPKRPRSALWAGACVGLALATSSSALIGLAILWLGLAFALITDDRDRSFRQACQTWRSDLCLVHLVLGLVGAIVLGGTLFYIYPSGLGAVADQLGLFATGLLHRVPGVAPAGAILALYELPVVMFGLVGAWLASQSDQPWQRFLSGWGVLAIPGIILYLGVRSADILWAILPLAALAGLAIKAMVADRQAGSSVGRWLHGLGILMLAGTILVTLARHLRAPRLLTLNLTETPFNMPLDLSLTVLWIVVGVIVWATIASMYGARHAFNGLGIGIMLVGGLTMLANAASLAFDRATDPHELWNVTPAQSDLEALVETAEEISEMAVGHPHEAEIMVQGSSDSTLGWALRNFRNVNYVNTVPQTVAAPIVIATTGGTDLTLGVDYVGQDFVVAQAWTPDWIDIDHFGLWLLYREADTPIQETRAILWVRGDIYQMLPHEIETIGVSPEG